MARAVDTARKRRLRPYKRSRHCAHRAPALRRYGRETVTTLRLCAGLLISRTVRQAAELAASRYRVDDLRAFADAGRRVPVRRRWRAELRRGWCAHRRRVHALLQTVIGRLMKMLTRRGEVRGQRPEDVAGGALVHGQEPTRSALRDGKVAGSKNLRLSLARRRPASRSFPRAFQAFPGRLKFLARLAAAERYFQRGERDRTFELGIESLLAAVRRDAPASSAPRRSRRPPGIGTPLSRWRSSSRPRDATAPRASCGRRGSSSGYSPAGCAGTKCCGLTLGLARDAGASDWFLPTNSEQRLSLKGRRTKPLSR